MKLKYQFVYQPVGNVILAVPVGEEARNYKGYVQLNETGQCIMEMMQEQDISSDEIVDRLMQEYEADREVIATAVDRLVDVLRKSEVIE